MSIRSEKDSLVAEKMFLIAEKMNDLNSSKVVKCGRQNGFGYSTIRKIFQGCTVRVHHNFDNSLSLDLLISPTALDKKPIQCESAKTMFSETFPAETQENSKYIIPSRADEPHYRLWLNITNRKNEEIIEILDRIIQKFAYPVA